MSRANPVDGPCGRQSGPPVRVRLAGDDDSAAWDRFVARHEGASVYHSLRWRTVMTHCLGREAHYLLAESASDGSIEGVLPLVRLRSLALGDFLVSLPYVTGGGILTEDARAEIALVEGAEALARRLGVSHVELRHERELSIAAPTRMDKVAMVLDLPPTHEELLQRLGSKVRAQVKRPLREGAETVHGGAELLGEFHDVYCRRMRHLGTPALGLRFFESILEAFPDAAALSIVRLHGRPVAAGLTLAHGRRQEIPWAASDPRADRFGVNMLLYASVLQRAIERRFREFDFGRCSRGSGPWHFKKQWGARERQLYWHYWLREGVAMPRLNHGNPRFAPAIAIWRRLPLWLANRLGARIAPILP